MAMMLWVCSLILEYAGELSAAYRFAMQKFCASVVRFAGRLQNTCLQHDHGCSGLDIHDILGRNGFMQAGRFANLGP